MGLRSPLVLDPYFAAFDLLTRDLHKLLEYIEPTDDNRKTYSHRTYELLLRVCTECESVWRDMVERSTWNTKKRDDLNGSDYRKLNADHELSCFRVRLPFWRPNRHNISSPFGWIPHVTPFEAWGTPDAGLRWYQDHHAVKHNRNLEFPLASFENVCLAFAGLFLTLAVLQPNGFETGMFACAHHNGNHAHTKTKDFEMYCEESANIFPDDQPLQT